MKSLARANIEHNWKNSSAIVFLLLMIGLVFYLIMGYSQAWLQADKAHAKHLNADILIFAKRNIFGELKQLGQVSKSNRRELNSSFGLTDYRSVINAWSSDNVEAIVPHSKNSTVRLNWRDNKGRYLLRIETRSVDISPDSMSFPTHIPVNIKNILATNELVAISKPLSRKYNLQLNDTINGIIKDGGFSLEEPEVEPFRVGAIIDGPEINTHFVLISHQMQEKLSDTKKTDVSMYMVRIKDKAKLNNTIAELSQLLGDKIQVSTPANKASFDDATSIFKKQKGLILVAIIVSLIMCMIAGVIMRNSILSYRFEFGTLVALGISKGQIAKIALQQALWLGVFSVAFTYCCALVIKFYLETVDTYLIYTIWMFIGVSTMLITISILAGLLSISALVKIKPIELMR